MRGLENKVVMEIAFRCEIVKNYREGTLEPKRSDELCCLLFGYKYPCLTVIG